MPTSSSIVLTRQDGSRPALHVKGATGHFTVDPADFNRVTDTRVFHLGGVGLMDAMDGPRNAAFMAHAKARGCITTVDIFAGSAGDLPDVDAVLPHTDYFIPSVEEAQALTGMTDLGQMAEFFLNRGAGACVFTLGADGAFYRDRAGLSFRIPAFAVNVRCTCGCGDAFNAGFASGLLNGMSPQDSVRLAQALAKHCHARASRIARPPHPNRPRRVHQSAGRSRWSGRTLAAIRAAASCGPRPIGRTGRALARPVAMAA